MRTPAAAVDTRGIAPTPERLLLIVDFFHSLGVRSLFFDFGDRFPWSIDSRLAGPGTFPDEAIAEIDRRCKRNGVSTYLSLRSLFPGRFTSVPTYRRLLRGVTPATGGSMPGSVCKLLGDLVEDALGLMPSLAGLCWVAAGDSRTQPLVGDETRRVVSEAGLSVGALISQHHGDPVVTGFAFVTDEETVTVVSADDLCDQSRPGQSIETRLPVVAAGLLGSSPSAAARNMAGELGDSSACVRCGEEVERYWEQLWHSVGRLHGLLAMAAEDSGLRGADLTGAARELRDAVGKAGGIEKEVAAAYAGRATAESVRRHLRPHFAAAREQHAVLAARTAHLRSIDHFTG